MRKEITQIADAVTDVPGDRNGVTVCVIYLSHEMKEDYQRTHSTKSLTASLAKATVSLVQTVSEYWDAPPEVEH